MKAFGFNPSRRAWDAYKVFHELHGPFVAFEDGSVALMRCRPEDRCYYPMLGLRVVGSNDAKFPKVFTDKKLSNPVTKADLNRGGQQLFVWDSHDGVGVLIPVRRTVWAPRTGVPKTASLSHAYWAAPEALGNSGWPAVVRWTLRRAGRQDVERQIAEVELRVRAVANLHGGADEYRKSLPSRLGREQYFSNVPFPLDADPDVVTAEVLGHRYKFWEVFHHGFARPTVDTEYSYLYTKEGPAA